MPPDSLKLLVDIQLALEDIRIFTAGMDFGMYRIDAKCRAAVERKFEVIGAACVRLRDGFPELRKMRKGTAPILKMGLPVLRVLVEWGHEKGAIVGSMASGFGGIDGRVGWGGSGEAGKRGVGGFAGELALI
jgi:hypothetical protein